MLSDYNLPGFSGLRRAAMLRERDAADGGMPVHPGLGRDRRGHRGRGDAQRRHRLPAEEQPGAAGAGDRARDRGARARSAPASRADRELAESRAAPVASWRSTCRPASSRARGDRARDPRRRRRLADGAEVRPRLDRAATPPTPEVHAARAGGAGDGDARHRSQPAHHAQPAPGDPRAGPGGGAAVDGQRASRSAPASSAQFRTSHDSSCRALPAGRAAGGLPHGAGGADQHQQARAGRRGSRSTCR